jgi:hypothetical protein
MCLRVLRKINPKTFGPQCVETDLQEIFHSQFMSTCSFKLYTVNQTVHCLRQSTAVYYSTLYKNPTKAQYFYNILSHWKLR